MNALAELRCAGAPRDLGFDQGRAAAARITREAALVLPKHSPLNFFRWLESFAPGGEARRMRRDTMRYFPHTGERSVGLARGAGVGTLALAALQGREVLDRSAGKERGPALALSRTPEQGGPLLLRAVDAPRGDLLLRTSEPDSGYRSVELTLAWRVPALFGVNECGLALAVSATHSFAPALEPAAPMVLLAQDCLQRFDTVDKALEWLACRPAGGAARFLLADASGARATFAAQGAQREVRMAEGDAPLAWNVDAPDLHPALHSEELDYRSAARALGQDERSPVTLIAQAEPARARLSVLFEFGAPCRRSAKED